MEAMMQVEAHGRAASRVEKGFRGDRSNQVRTKKWY